MIRFAARSAAIALATTALAGCASMAPEHTRPPLATAPVFDPDYRPDGEVAASQDRMLRKAPAPLDDGLSALMRRQNEAALSWLAANHIPCLRLRFEALHEDPAAEAARLAEFCGCAHAAPLMAAAVDPSLYRNRIPE